MKSCWNVALTLKDKQNYAKLDVLDQILFLVVG